MSLEIKKRLSLSVSSIGTYEKCPKKYWYNYIEKPNIPKQKWDHLEFGSFVHLVLEKFHKYLIEQFLPQSEYPSLMKKCMEQALKEFDENILEKDVDLVQGTLQSYLHEIKKNGLPNVLFVEKPFLMEIGDYNIRGFIDRIDKAGDGHYHVVDYKTSKDPKYLTPFQLMVYSFVIKEEFPDAEKITGSYMLLKHNCAYKTWEISDQDIEDCKMKIVKFGNLISTDKEWEKKPSKLCDFCDFKDICINNWAE
jgi:RecB family exonuclease